MSSPAEAATDPTIEEIKREIDEMKAAAYASPTKDCDMVMKGGITSGVVYPLTVAEAAKTYRLHNIGGASAGAIAACAAAAAEYRRTVHGDDGGFRALAELPEELGECLPSLFQPSPELKRPFAVLMAALAPEPKGKVLGVVRAVVGQRLLWFIGGATLTLLIGLYGLIVMAGLPISGAAWQHLAVALVPTVLTALVIGLLASVLGLAVVLLRQMPGNGYGLCDGLSNTIGHDPPLTPWLTETINRIAGRLPDGTTVDDPGFEPLTVGDLWGEEAVTAWEAATDARFVGRGPEWRLQALRRIDLQVMVTNLTARRPLRVPFADRTLFFDRAEMATYFPERVVATMVSGGEPSDHLHPDTGAPLWAFPDVRSLPVVVLARLSLSFPGLISAVPLYAVDYSNRERVVRQWISDGGISSNFPIHFFDRLLPSRPTFGINLQPLHPTDPAMVDRPKIGDSRITLRMRPLGAVTTFIGAILDTMQNWADTSQASLKGFADRVVEVRQTPLEGGMNLRMPTDRILTLAHRGKLAGLELAAFQFEPNRVARYRIALTRLTDALDHLQQTWTDGDLEELLRTYDGPGGTWLASPTNRGDDIDATQALVDLMLAWQAAGYPALAHNWPKPAPDLRMSAR